MTGNNNLITDLGNSLKADPKKTGSLAVLVLLLAVLVGRQFMGGRVRPQSASAATVGNQLNAVSVAQKKPAASVSRVSAAASEALQKWGEQPATPISRNLFAVRIDYFPLDGSRTTQNGAPDGGFWVELEKSMSLRTDERQRRENQIASFKVEAEKLKLESIMLGAAPRAMIDGQLVGEGNVVANFRVVKIEARRVIIERDGIMLEIQMK
jgi:hypothetical protein